MSTIPSPVQTVLDLFATDLAEVRFGDLDAKTLDSLASDVRSAADAVASAQALLDDARSKLQERQEALLQQAQRALAYARVYAEPDAALTERIEAISLPRPVRRVRAETEVLALSPDPDAPKRPRGRPRKTPLEAPMLEGLSASAE
jgi:hypothetical protein